MSWLDATNGFPCCDLAGAGSVKCSWMIGTEGFRLVHRGDGVAECAPDPKAQAANQAAQL